MKAAAKPAASKPPKVEPPVVNVDNTSVAAAIETFARDVLQANARMVEVLLDQKRSIDALLRTQATLVERLEALEAPKVTVKAPTQRPVQKVHMDAVERDENGAIEGCVLTLDRGRLN